MNRLHKILLGVFCGGVLLCGIGTGIAVTEFSNLEYAGEKLVGEHEMKTETIDVELELGEKPMSILGVMPSGYGVTELIPDENVPENTVRFQISYNAKQVEPVLEQEKDQLSLYWHWLSQDEMGIMMEIKDEVIQDLKEGRVASYRTKDVEELKILINPADEEKIEAQNW